MYEIIWDAELPVLTMASSLTFGCLVLVLVLRKRVVLDKCLYIHNETLSYYRFEKPIAFLLLRHWPSRSCDITKGTILSAR